MALTDEQFARLQELHGKYGGPSKVAEPTADVVEQGQQPQLMQQDNQGFFGSITDAVKDFGIGVKGAWQERMGNIKDIKRAGVEGEIGDTRGVFRTSGQLAGFLGDVVGEGVQLAAPQGVEKVAGQAMEAVGQTEPVQNAVQKYDEFKTKHPQAAADLEAFVNIASIIPAGKGAQLGAKGAVKGAVKAGDVLTDVNTRTVARLGNTVDARRAANIAAREAETRDLVGRITQGKKGTQDAAIRALSEVDTTNVRTYAALNRAIENQTEALARQLDEYLDARPEVLTKDSLTKTSTVSGKTVSVNYVDEAVKQLDELYDKIKAPEDKARIEALTEKLNTEGLTRRELNDLAREYGRTFGQKAFSRTGDPLTSVNAQAYENTRKGVKEAFRSTLDDDTAKILDRKMSDLLNTSVATRKMEEKVNNLWQKVKPRTVPERLARGAANIVDTATLHTVSSFLSRMLPSNVGLKTMNSLDIEAELAKNLKKLDKINANASGDDVITAILAAAKEQAENPALGMSISKVKPETIAKRMSGEDYVVLQNYHKFIEHGNYIDIDNPDFVAGDRLLEQMGINTLSAPYDQQKKFVLDVLDSYEQTQMRMVPVTSQQVSGPGR